MRRFIFLTAICITTFICNGQTNNVETIIKKIERTKDDSTKIALYNQLAWKYIFSDKQKAIATLNTVEKIAKRAHQEYGYNSFLNVKGVYYDVNGESDSAQLFFEKSLQYSIDNHFADHEAHSLNNLGMFSWNKGKYEEALKYYFKSLALAEAKLDGQTNARKDAAYNNIGLIYQDMGLCDKAIQYHYKALAIRIKKENIQGQAASYNNLGICYKNLGKLTEAKRSFENGIVQANKTNDKILYYQNLQGLAGAEAENNNPQQALKLYLESYNRSAEIPYSNNEKVSTTSGIAKMYLDLNQVRKSIKYGELCVAEINKDTTTYYTELGVYETLAQAFYAVGNIAKGAYYNKKFYEATAKKFKGSTATALQELETKYETQKKEIALQKSKATLKQKNTLIVGAFGLAFLLGLIGYLVYKQQRLRNTQLIKENELKEALTKIANQNSLHEQRLAISKDLHDNIGSQLTFIISSLDNLKYFEFAKDKLYEKFDSIGGFTKNTITDLRDTIWAMNKEEITFEDLKTRTTNFIEAAKTSLRGIQFEFNYPPNMDNTPLNAKLGIDVYRIIQEAINNGVKHAQATRISVNFELLNQNLKISIMDNGIGFDPSVVEMGHGLQSMKKRAEAIAAQLKIKKIDKGTAVNLQFRIAEK